MKKPFIHSEESFTRYVNTLCCSHCAFFIEGACTHPNAEQHNKEKEETAKAFEKSYHDGWAATPPPVSPAREEMLNSHLTVSKNINDTFLCEEYKSK